MRRGSDERSLPCGMDPGGRYLRFHIDIGSSVNVLGMWLDTARCCQRKQHQLADAVLALPPCCLSIPERSEHACLRRHHAQMTFPSASVRRDPFDESRMTSRFCHGSSITAHKLIRISNGPAINFPPASTNPLIAAGTEATKNSVSIGRSSVCNTSSASESGSRKPAAESSRQMSS